MSFMDSQSQAWDSAHWEFSLVFEDLDDNDLWRRADPRLLSVGELVCHLVYALTTYANKVDPTCGLASPLARNEARYYLHSVDDPFLVDMSVHETAVELDRVQKETKAVFAGSNAQRDEVLSFEGPGRTYGEFVDYLVFHAAYHTGQAFSVRHLMGHKTNDN